MTGKSDDEDYDDSSDEQDNNSAVSEPNSDGNHINNKTLLHKQTRLPVSAGRGGGAGGKQTSAPAKKRGQDNSGGGGGSGQQQPQLQIGANGALQYQTPNGKLLYLIDRLDRLCG